MKRRKALAWEDIEDQDSDRLDDNQKRQLAENLKKAQRDLRECVWRTYKHALLLDKDNNLQVKDFGLVHSSAASGSDADSFSALRQDGDVEEAVSPTFLVRHWPPAFKEWSTEGCARRLLRIASVSSPDETR